MGKSNIVGGTTRCKPCRAEAVVGPGFEKTHEGWIRRVVKYALEAQGSSVKKRRALFCQGESRLSELARIQRNRGSELSKD